MYVYIYACVCVYVCVCVCRPIYNCVVCVCNIFEWLNLVLGGIKTVLKPETVRDIAIIRGPKLLLYILVPN